MRRLRHAVSRPCDAICAVLEPSAVLRVVRCGRCCSHIRFCDELIADALRPLPRECGASAHQLAAADAPCAAARQAAQMPSGATPLPLCFSQRPQHRPRRRRGSRFFALAVAGARDVPPRAWCLGRLSFAPGATADVKNGATSSAKGRHAFALKKKWLDDRTAAESYSVWGCGLVRVGSLHFVARGPARAAARRPRPARPRNSGRAGHHLKS